MEHPSVTQPEQEPVCKRAFQAKTGVRNGFRERFTAFDRQLAPPEVAA
jgi:hypothetical protein